MPTRKRRTSTTTKRSSVTTRSQAKRKRRRKDETTAATTTTKTKTRALLQLKNLVRGRVLRRPSRRNRSPYVADVRLEETGREIIAHVPCMDMGGNSGPGAEILLKVAVDRKGVPIGPHAVSKKYGTPRCEFIAQLVRNKAFGTPWIVAHPRLGEDLASTLIRRTEENVESFAREVVGVCGTNMRVDFLLSHADGSRTALEVKTVVDADVETRREDGPKIQFPAPASLSKPYRRAAIFPWGRSNQRGPDGEKVVSARAIKHVDELAKIGSGALRTPEGERIGASILFICGRGDVEYFRPNAEACASFARHLKDAERAGVRVRAQRVRWGEGADEGTAFWEGEIPVVL